MEDKKNIIRPDEVKTMENVASIPYIAYEVSERRHERTRNKLLIMIGCLITLLFICNMAWLYVFQSYDYASYSQDGEGYNNIVTGTSGDISNGTESKSPG